MLYLRIEIIKLDTIFISLWGKKAIVKLNLKWCFLPYTAICI